MKSKKNENLKAYLECFQAGHGYEQINQRILREINNAWETRENRLILYGLIKRKI